MNDENDTQLPTVNQKVIDAVDYTQQFVFDNHNNKGQGTQTGTAIGYQKVSQAAAFAVQDATDYLRNMMTISATTQGVVLKLMVEHKEEAPLYIPILEQAQAAVTAAQENLEAVGTSAGTVMSKFPSSST